MVMACLDYPKGVLSNYEVYEGPASTCYTTSMNLSIYTDGGAKGNPGPAAIGGVVYNGDRPPKTELNKAENELLRLREDIGNKTNNEAEYQALVTTLEHVRDYIADEGVDVELIDCYSDSELMIKQLKGEYKVKQPHIRDFVFKIRVLESELKVRVIYHHIRREHNKLADALVNDAV